MKRWFNQIPVLQQTTRLHSDNYSEIGMYIREYQVTIYENDWKVAQMTSSSFYTQENFEKEFANRESFTQNINMIMVLQIVEMNLKVEDFARILLEAISRANEVISSDNYKTHILAVLDFVEENEDGTYSLKDILPF